MSQTTSKPQARSSSLVRSSAIMFAGTLASRLLGFVRNALIVVALGATASGAADAFNTANALPTQLYNLLLGGILNAVLVPQIVRALSQEDGDEVVNRLLTAAGALVAVVTGIITIASPFVVMLYASGLGRWQPLALAFTFWCMPQIFFYGLTALWGQVLNAKEHFGPYMWAPVVNNIVAITSLLAYMWLYGSYTAGEGPQTWQPSRIAVIAGGATLGIVMQALCLYLPLRQIGFRPRVVWGVKGIGLRQTSVVATWALAGVLVTGVADIAWTNLGSAAVTAAEKAADTGLIIPSTTMWSNAQLIYLLPQSLVTASVMTALFTRMSVKAAKHDGAGVRDDFSLGARSVAVFTMLASAGIAVLATPALQAFVPSLSLEEAQASSPILVALALGIMPQGLWFAAQRVPLAYTDTKRLFWAYAPVGLLPVVAAFLIHAFAPAQHWMMLAAVVNTLGHPIGTAVLVPVMRRYVPDLDAPRLISTHLRLGLAAAAAALVGLLLRSAIGPADGSMTGARPLDALVTILVVATAMTVVYLVVASLARVEETSVIMGPLARVLAGVGRRLGPAGTALTSLASWLKPAPGTESLRGLAPQEPQLPAPGQEDGTQQSLPETPPPGQRVRAGAGVPPAPRPQALAAPRAVPAPVPDGAAAGGSGPVRPVAPAKTISRPNATMEADARAKGRSKGMDEGKPIGSGRYRVLDTLPTTLPHIVRHRGRDTILDRDVTIMVLTPATAHREEVLSAAARAVLIDDKRCQSIYDVDPGANAFIVAEPLTGVTLPTLVSQGLSAPQARAIIGEAAQALASASLRNLHHLVLKPESLRVTSSGLVKVAGIGIEGAAQGKDARFRSPLLSDQDDAKALVELLYYALTGRWPGKHSGIRPAPRRGGVPVPPSEIAAGVTPEVDALFERTWKGEPPRSAADVAALLEPWPALAPPKPKAPPPPAPVSAPAVPPAPASSAPPTSPKPSDSGSGSGNGNGHSLGDTMTVALSGAGAVVSAVGAGAAAAASSVAGATRDVLSRINRGLHTGQVPTSKPEGLADTKVLPDHAPVTKAQSVPASAEGDIPTVVVDRSQLPTPADPGSTRVVDIDSVRPQPAAPVAVESPLITIEGTSPVQNDVQDTILEDEGTSLRARRTTNAIIISVFLAILVAVVLAITNLLDLARVPLTDEEIPAAKTVPSAVSQDQDPQVGSDEEQGPAPVITGAKSLDPFGDNNEHPELQGLLTDGDPSTEWFSRYYRNPSLAQNGKAGIGVAVTLEGTATISTVELQGTGAGGRYEIRQTSLEEPSGGKVLSEGAFTQGTTTATFEPLTTNQIVIWITDMPRAADGSNKVTISEITVR